MPLSDNLMNLMKFKQISTELTSILFYVVGFFYLVALPVRADHARVTTPDIEFSCDQTEDSLAIRCDYRLITPDLTNKISATLNATELPIRDIHTYPFEDSTSSILFMLDTSASDELDILSHIKEQATAFAQQALLYQQIGLATFDASLNILQPLGTEPEAIINSIGNIVETRQPTELYRNILDGLKLLKTSQADRKALYIFSTGESADQAIYHSDVVSAAQAENIKIISIGFPDPRQSVNSLQNLKLLSKDTAGFFVSASEDGYELPEAILSDPFSVIDNGGVLTIDLTPALAGDLQGLQIAMLVFETSNKRITVKLPLELSPTDSKAAEFKGGTLAQFQSDPDPANEGTTASGNTTASGRDPEQSILSKTDPVQDRTSGLLTGLWIILAIVLLLFVVSALVYFKLRHRKPKAKAGQAQTDKHLGWLVTLNDESITYPIESSPWKIGRTRQNNLFFEHSSVSRNHAEIRRNRDGSLTVVDLDSLNGVYVNNNKVSTGLIKDGDRIDIGDIRLKYVTRLDE